MEPRWTKGPWLHVATKGGWDGVAAADGIPICSLSYNNPANATLAAAAPDLYDALAEAKNALADYIPQIEATGASLNYGHSVLLRARAAPAKARGESA